MDGTLIGIIALGLLLFLLATGLPIGIIFVLLSVGGLSLILDFERALSMLGQSLYHNVSSPNWAALPLFILLGYLSTSGGYAQRAFRALNKITEGLTGALGIATCFSCAFFGAMSGSPAATAAIFAQLTLPEMRRYGYDKRFAAGIVASAGTFAAMIPPSGLMIVYALLTKQSIGRLFAAGIIPGIMTAIIYSFIIFFKIKRKPSLVKQTIEDLQHYSLVQRILALIEVWPVLLVAGVVLGGIYGGYFTPTEAAAAGCATVLIMGFYHGTLRSLKNVRIALRNSASTTSMIFFFIICAIFFSRFLAFTQIPINLAAWISEFNLPRYCILIGILAVWFILGMVMIPDGIYVLTIPIFFPLIEQLGYDPIWFGILTIKMSEIANVTPPVGLNIFTIQGAMGNDLTAEDIYSGIWPFVAGDLFVLTLMFFFPQIVLWLPNKII
jgi:tripartite ATP-independent transporter DctM subunit